MPLDETKGYSQETLEQWVMGKCDDWRDNFQSNYKERFDEYYRLWRGIWAKEDSLRNSERSRLISPALQQAVESSVAEVEEATFGRGRWFDIKDDFQDGGQDSLDVEFIRKQLSEDMQYARTRSSISECILNAAVFGTGIGELYLEETTEAIPATRPALDGTAEAVGVEKRERFLVKLRPIMPQNFLIDPVATSVSEALGCAVDQYVPYHQVRQDIDAGIYRDVDIDLSSVDDELEPDQGLTYDNDDRVRLTRYYGLVPANLLEEARKDEDSDDEDELSDAIEPEYEQSYVEAIVVIANGDTLLKVEPNPYMMNDRPIVAFSWDQVPSRFWGRGICEKGYNSQKALDTEMRARIDALALTVHPMMAVDASRMPRGAKYEIRPGKTLLTNGNPAEIMKPFNFGSVSDITFVQATQLQNMVQQATGAVDTASFAGGTQNGTAAGISMSIGAVIKRHKRTLLNFQENFLIPFVSMAAVRYMQFDPDLYKAQDFKFVASGSLGLAAREYEVSQLVQLLQTMPQDSPMYAIVLESVVDSMNLSSRESISAQMKQMNQPNPEQQQAQQQAQQMQLALAQLQVQKAQAEVAEISSRVEQNGVETQLLPIAEETNRISALANAQPETEFDQLIKMAELELKELAIESKENIVEMQMVKGAKS
jgi:hypothetical protein